MLPVSRLVGSETMTTTMFSSFCLESKVMGGSRVSPTFCSWRGNILVQVNHSRLFATIQSIFGADSHGYG